MSSRNIAQGLARSCLKTSAARSWPRPRALPRPFSSPHSSSSYHSAASAPSPLAPSAFGHRPFARTFHTTHGQPPCLSLRLFVLTSCRFSRSSLWHRPSRAWYWVRLPVTPPCSCPCSFARLSIKVHFRDHKGNLIKTVEANEGDDLLSIAHEYDIDLEGAQSPVFVYCFPLNHAHAFIGACEASMACSTCHVILDPEVYDQLPEPEVCCSLPLALSSLCSRLPRTMKTTCSTWLLVSPIPPALGVRSG